MNQWLDRFLPKRETRAASANALDGLGSAELDLIQSLINQARAQTTDILHSDHFLQEHQAIIEQAIPNVQAQIQQKVLEMVEARPEVIQTIQPPEIQPVTSRTGKLPTSSRRLYVRHAMLGSTPPPLRTQEVEVPGKEQKVIPELTIAYGTILDASLVPGSRSLEKLEFILATLAKIDPDQLNASFKDYGFRVGKIKLELRAILSGSYGSRAGSITVELSGQQSNAANTALTELATLLQKVHEVKDDGIGLTTDARMVVLVDDLINESLQAPVIPILAQSEIWYASRSASSPRRRRIRKKDTDGQPTTSILVFQNHAHLNSKPLHEEELYV